MTAVDEAACVLGRQEHGVQDDAWVLLAEAPQCPGKRGASVMLGTFCA